MDSQQMDDVDLAIIADRNRDLQNLDNDMEQLAEVFSDVNRMVGQQGEQIDQAAGNVQVAESNSASGEEMCFCVFGLISLVCAFDMFPLFEIL
jgi:hypothetical protein